MDDDLEILFDEQAIDRMVRELGERISRDYAGGDLVLVGVLKGAALFLADLARAVSIPVEMDFLQASSYGQGTASTGAVRISRDLSRDVRGRNVLVVDCIIDSGRTLAAVLAKLREQQPASLKAVVLLDKRSRRTAQAAVDYAGFDVPDRFLVGYGLDRAGQYRNLPFIAVLKQE
jgi:hypoxanthine phosphoribosyltransferase